MHRNEQKGEPALLGLAEVIAATGLSKLVLHAWERRYGITPAERTATGRRFYTGGQVARLQLLKACSEGGHRIGTLVSLPDATLAHLAQEIAAKRALGDIFDAVEALDGDRLQELLQARADAETPEDFIRITALPLMREIGTRWAAGRITIAAEHMTTAHIKRILGGMFDRCPPGAADAPRLIATTPEREEHDIGALVITLLARLRGWNALFLGANLPTQEIVEAAHRRGVEHVCLSALTGRPAPLERQLRALRSTLAPGISLWIGGQAFATVAAIPGVTYLPDLDMLLKALDGTRTALPRAI